jgi:Cof subfamily protein (haloacid dehalogenase superfamily)
MIRVIAIDLDDTLIAPDKHIPGSNLQAVQAAQEAGIHVVIVTARGWLGSRAIYEQLGLDTPLILSSGSRLVDGNGQTRWLREMPLDFCREVISFCTEHEIALRVYVGDEIWNNASHDPLKGNRLTTEIRMENMANEMHRAAYQIYTKGQRETDLLKERFGAEGSGYKCNILIYSDGIPEVSILHPLSNKGAALAALCAEWNVPREEVMAIGDSLNDLSMIEWAGLGVAMSWAPEHVRLRADVVTQKGNPAGCGDVIMKVVRGQMDVATFGKQATGF